MSAPLEISKICPLIPEKPGFGPARQHYMQVGLPEETIEGVSNLHENLLRGVSISKDKPLFGRRIMKNGKAGKYVYETYGQVLERVLNFGSGLRKIGTQTDVKIALFSVNRPEWVIAEHGCYVQGFITVPLYDTLGSEAIEYIISFTETPLIVCSGDKIKRLFDLAPKMPSLKTIVSMDPIEGELRDKAKAAGVGLYAFDEIEVLGKENPAEKVIATPQTVATISFTSGTTGIPKGAVLTHQNLLSANTHAIHTIKHRLFEPITNKTRHLSYLPLAHIYERIIQVSIMYYGGVIGFYQGDTQKIVEDAQAFKPTLFISVPRLYNRIYEKVTSGIRKKGGLVEKLFKMALKAKLANLPKGKYKHFFWDFLVFNKIKKSLGGKVVQMFSGAAPLTPEVIDFLRCAFCCPLTNGYGQTENTAGGSATVASDFTVGSIGCPQFSSLVRLRDVPELNYFSTDKPHPRGEICVKGPCVFKEYYKSPEKTAEALTEDGWLLSGDIGKWDEQGRLHIIDRLKNIFKLAQGEYIAPDKIEAIAVELPIVQQIFVYGDSIQSELVAIVVPDQDLVMVLGHELGVEGTYDEICKNLKVCQSVAKSFEKTGKAKGLLGFEIPKAVHLSSEPFTPENGLLSPTFKLKRHEAKARFSKKIAALYALLEKEKAKKQ